MVPDSAQAAYFYQTWFKNIEFSMSATIYLLDFHVVCSYLWCKFFLKAWRDTTSGSDLPPAIIIA